MWNEDSERPEAGDRSALGKHPSAGGGSFLGHPGGTVLTGNTSGAPWAPGSNPYGGASEVVLSSDLVIDNSIDLYVENMTFRFAPTARLVIRPGAYARFKNCVLTSYQCDNARWPGIRVEGNTAQDQSDQTDAQGRSAGRGRFTGGGVMELDLTALASGVYTVRCIGSDAKGRQLVKR